MSVCMHAYLYVKYVCLYVCLYVKYVCMHACQFYSTQWLLKLLFTHLTVHDVGQVKGLLNDGHEALSQDLGHKDVAHRQQTVRPECLNQQQLVHSLANRS